MRIRIDDPGLLPDLVAFLDSRVHLVVSAESAYEVEVSVLGSFADGGRADLAAELEQWTSEHPDAGIAIVPPPRIERDLGDELSLRLMPLPEAADFPSGA
ncbi:MAG TPA: hypothetical protein VFP31_01845 [Gaiellaceae bacterium]|nr:hypothetical protein [Gaiellaceae bacterium]